MFVPLLGNKWIVILSSMIYISAMEHRLTPTIASRLWELRTRQRLTRKALATKARINAETIYRIEGSRYGLKVNGPAQMKACLCVT